MRHSFTDYISNTRLIMTITINWGKGAFLMNDNLVLISGKTATGKSAALRNIKDPGGVAYLNCENNKKLPFKSGFREEVIVDPKQIYKIMLKCEQHDDIHTIVIDSLTFCMDMYESVHVLTSPNTMQAWGKYAQFFKVLMSQYVAVSTKNVIFIAHTLTTDNEKLEPETKVKVKGSLMNNGIESFFSTVISTKKVPTKILEDYKSDLLNITPQEEALGFKYVFQTQLTKETVNEAIRSSMGMWSIEETFIDNDVQLVIDRLHDYYQ